jgi:hypothetical protein
MGKKQRNKRGSANTENQILGAVANFGRLFNGAAVNKTNALGLARLAKECITAAAATTTISITTTMHMLSRGSKTEQQKRKKTGSADKSSKED